jgi:hypothetical protein
LFIDYFGSSMAMARKTDDLGNVVVTLNGRCPDPRPFNLEICGKVRRGCNGSGLVQLGPLT